MKKRSKTRVVGYLRVSTEQQDLENQRYGILKLANRNKWQVDFVEEKVSGKVPVEERELGKVIKTLKQDDVLIVTELSRLGRSMIEIMTLLGKLLEIGVKVFALKGDYKLDGSMQSRIMTMVLCMASEIEKELLSQRVKEALLRKKQEGVILGRPKGVPGKSKLDGKDNEIKLLLDKKVSISSLAKIHDCSWPTMKNFTDKKILI